MIWLLILIFTLLLVGGAMFVRGYLGRIEPTDPRCVRCDYNLSGLDQETQRQCPECGADLFAPRSVRFARPRRNIRLMTAGLVLFAAGLLLMTIAAA